MSEAVASPTLLFVDDEPSILSALRRLFRPHGYRILVAESGMAGLSILEQETVDLIISDMRMPEMDGATFLKEARQRWPNAMRILLTGYADVTSTVAAINDGEIYRYISKPWDDHEIVNTVREALERQKLEVENRRLTALTQAQNEELKALNSGLEQKVAERTAELRQALAFVEQSHGELKKAFLTSVQVFAGLIELRGGRLAGHGRRVADMARNLAHRLELSEAEIQNVMLAGLLHDIGKLGWSDELLAKPFNTLTPDQRAQVMKHPQIGQNLLMAIDRFKDAAILVRHHHECFDGSGYPDHLAGMAIPLGARILAVANDRRPADRLAGPAPAAPGRSPDLPDRKPWQALRPVGRRRVRPADCGDPEGRSGRTAAAHHAPQARHGADARTDPPRRLSVAGQGQHPDRRHHQSTDQAGADRTAQPDPLHPPGGKMSRVMLVDDEESILKSLKRILRLAPCSFGGKTFQLEVETYTSPMEAIEAAKRNDYDLFISDYRMPIMDGIEFLKATKEIQPDAARLILSGYADLNALVRAVNEVGIDRFIGKPWNDYDLMSAIGQALAHRELLLENRQLANLVRMEMGDTTPEEVEAERLESIEPGITEVNWGPDGSVILDPEFQLKN